MTASHNLFIDLESYSPVNIKNAGVKNYAQEAQVLMVGASLDNGPVTVYDCYHDELPGDFIEMLCNPDYKKIAWNEKFDRVVLSAWLKRKGYIKENLPADQWADTMVQAGALGLPQGLAMCSLTLSFPNKDESGKDFINYFCMDVKPTKKNEQRTRNLPEHDMELWNAGLKYCKIDVELLVKITAHLANYPLHDFDEKIFHLDQEINDRGWAVDREFIDKAIEFEDIFDERRKQKVFELTGVDSPTKRAAIHKWLREVVGLNIPKLDQQTCLEWLDRASPIGKEVLQLRMAGSQTSKAKYAKLKTFNCDGRVYDMFRMYGAATGRWSGNGPQLQNVPRSSHTQKDLDIARDLIREGKFDEVELLFDEPSDIPKQLIRSCLTTFLKRLVGSDLSSIESRILAWLVNLQWALEVFQGDGKIYERTAEKMFNLPEGSVKKDSPERMKGKVASLSLQYQGGVGALIQMGATRSGLTEEELPAIVNAYRQANPEIVAFWNEITQLCILALSKGEEQVYQPYKDRDPLLRVKYKKGSAFLQIQLPSGRNLSYFKPTLTLDKFGNPAMHYAGMKALKVGGKTEWNPAIETYGGRLTNNIVQGIARDILAEGMLRAKAKGLKIVGHVHDEIICESDDDGTLEILERCMSEEIGWAVGLPLRAEGFVCKNYRKG